MSGRQTLAEPILAKLNADDECRGLGERACGAGQGLRSAPARGSLLRLRLSILLEAIRDELLNDALAAVTG